MDRQQQGPHGDDDFFESLRRAAARPPAELSSTTPDLVQAPGRASGRLADASPVASGTADVLRDLEARMAEVEQQLRRLNEERARLVSDVADAVVAKLDARWTHALRDDDVPS